MRTHRKSAPRWLWPAVGALAVALFLGGLTGRYLTIRATRIADAKAWTVAGPPCPQLTEAEFTARKLKAPKTTDYEDVVFGRQFGHMDCRALRYGAGWGTETYPVCQFTSPSALTVATDKGRWFFAPGPGKPATVAVPRGEARCVMDSNFTLPG